MANKYCIASGLMTDPNIWEPAGVPTTGDDVLFDRDVTVDYWNYSDRAGNISITNNATVHLIGRSSGSRTDFNLTNKTLTIDGHLEYTCTDSTAYQIYLTNSTLDIRENATLKINRASSSGVGEVCVLNRIDNVTSPGFLWNMGFIDANVFIVTTVNNNPTHVVGKVKNARLRNQDQSACLWKFDGHIDAEEFQIYTAVGAPGTMEVDFGPTEIRVRKLLQLNNISDQQPLTIRHNGLMDVCGNISSSEEGGAITWIPGSLSKHFLSGTADQTISLPTSFSGTAWTVDKPAGKLELTAFNGFLQGRLQELIVGDHCNVDLSGPAPYLPNSRNEYSYYNGLKADSVSERNLATKRLESMTCCENRGVLAIPAGRQVWAKQFQNKAGAQVTGNGLLGIRYGGLENSGTIESSIWTEVFDVPELLPLATLQLKYGDRPGRIDAEWTRAENATAALDWGDGTPPVECVEVAGTLSHAYSASGRFDIEINARSDTRKSRARVTANVKGRGR